jgi:excisionase family DNA binding protein
MSEYMTTQELADMLRAPVETVRYWRHVGKGPESFKVGRRVLYDRAEVEAFVRGAQNAASVASRPTVDGHPLAEKIARKIEAQSEFEGPRAQRIIRMCAEVARSVQP